MKPNENIVNLTLNTLLNKKYPEVNFDFSYYYENIYGQDRIVSNIYMSAPDSYYKKMGDNMKHYYEIESEVRTIMKIIGFTNDDPVYYHWVGEDHFRQE